MAIIKMTGYQSHIEIPKHKEILALGFSIYTGCQIFEDNDSDGTTVSSITIVIINAY